MCYISRAVQRAAWASPHGSGQSGCSLRRLARGRWRWRWRHQRLLLLAAAARPGELRERRRPREQQSRAAEPCTRPVHQRHVQPRHGQADWPKDWQRASGAVGQCGCPPATAAGLCTSGISAQTSAALLQRGSEAAGQPTARQRGSKTAGQQQDGTRKLLERERRRSPVAVMLRQIAGRCHAVITLAGHAGWPRGTTK
ncbi:hypothetical protein BC831DRAFT_473369 [Entophlyctis helioformis]|nr:hypothetical protein BC831DRAFT_473369 [Entophlyctis helioformis]